jgi:hypothetical protein
MTGDVVTINASLVYQGATYQAVPITISKIFNQLVAKTTRAIDLLPAYTDGSGYTLPAADNFIELYNGVVKLTTGVVYGPSEPQTKNGLTATVNNQTGQITLSQLTNTAWTSSTESFTFTATRGAIAYSTTYTITKAKAGTGGRQVAGPSLYKWSTAQPAAPTAQSTYNWFTQEHTYAGTDWSTTVDAFNGVVGLKLWKITKIIDAEALTTVQSYTFSWVAPITIRQVTTEANEVIKTAIAKVYRVALSTPTISGTSRYDWTSNIVVPNLATLEVPNPTTAPSGWTGTQPTSLNPGFTLYQAAVNVIDRQSASYTNIDWTGASVTPISYAGGSGLNGITAILTNDTHAIPTDSADSTRNLTNSGTDIFIYEGATPLVYDTNYADATGTGKFTVTAVVDGVTIDPPVTVTVPGTGTGVRYPDLKTADFLKTATGSITFTITGRRLTTEPGQTLGIPFTYTVKQSFTKTPSGIQGVPGAVYWITTSAGVIQRTTPVAGSPAFNPATITFTAKKSIGSTPSDYTEGYVKLYRNGAEVEPKLGVSGTTITPITSYTYTIPADTTSVRYELYSDNTFQNLLDSETVPVVADGGKGDQGLTGISARRAYIIVPSSVTPANTPAEKEVAGSANYPPNATWFTTNSNNITWTVSWTATAPNSITEGFTLYQSDGLYNVATDKTIWNPPYISSLKVGNLAAISVNTGGLTISDYIKGGSNVSSLDGNNSGDGFYVSSTGHLRVGAGNNAQGNPTGARLKFDSSGLKISNAAGTDIFEVVSSSQSAAAESARLAGLSQTAATNAANTAVSTIVEYSPNGSTGWTQTYVVGTHFYIRTSSKTAADTAYTPGPAAKFIPQLNTDYYQPATFDITNTGVTFNKNAAGTVTPATVTLSTAYANIAGTVSYQWQKNGSNISSATSSTYAVPKADFDSSTSNNYTCTITGTINGVANQTRSDSITIPLLADGSSAIQVLNSNENISFAADTTGQANISFTNGSSAITAYIGTNQLDYAANGANTFSATLEATGATVPAGSGSGKTFTVPVPSAMAGETAYTTVTVIIRDAANVATTVKTVVSYSLARKGIKPVLGTDYYQPATFDITNTGITFKKDSAGEITPAFVTLTTAYANIAGTPTYQWQLNGNNISSATSSTYAVTKIDFNSRTSNTYTCTITGTINGVASQTRSDSITIPLLADGSSAIQVLNSNENITFSGPKTGQDGISFTNGSSAITAYIGTNQLDYAANGANTFSATLEATGATVPAGSSSGKTFTVPAPTAMAGETAYTTVTVVIRDAANLATTVKTVVSYSLSRKGETGVGTDGAGVQVEFSQTGTANTWHATYASGDMYIRTNTKAAGATAYTEGVAAKFVGEGKDGSSVAIRYSTDGTGTGAGAWNLTFDSSHYYMQTGTKAVGAADYTWGTVAKFRPKKGTDYDDGVAGARGSLTGYGRQFGIYSTIWSNTLANRVIHNMINSASATGELSTYTHLQVGDTVTLTNAATATAAFTRYYIGNNTWSDPATIINGDLLVKGTVAADRISANQQFIGHEIRNSSGTFIMNFGASPYISISV